MVRQTKTVRAAIAAIPEAAWVQITYQPDGVAQVAETPYRGDRLIVRRARKGRTDGPTSAGWEKRHGPIGYRLRRTAPNSIPRRASAIACRAPSMAS
jgi:hypothetical protein